MAESANIHGVLFGGFNRQDVMDYISSLNEKSKKALAAKESELVALRQENQELATRVSELYSGNKEVTELRQKLSAQAAEYDGRVSELSEKLEASGEALLSANEKCAKLEETLAEIVRLASI